MTFYVVLWIILLVCGVQYYFTNRVLSRNFYVLIILGLSFIVAARGQFVGADTGNYLDFYYSGVAPDKLSGVYEPVFMLIRYVCYFLGFNHFVFFFILAFATLYVLYIVCEKLKFKDKFLPLFIYFSMVFLSYHFNTLRNGVMASIIWLAFAYKQEGKDKAAIITMIVAAGFHAVALAFIPILYVINKELEKKWVFVAIIIALVCVTFNLGVKLINQFPILRQIDRLAGYIDASNDETYGITMGTIVNVSLFLFMYIFHHSTYRLSVELRVILNAMLCAIMVVCVFNAFQAIVSRIGQVLNMSLMFVWPYFINKLRPKIIQIGACAVVCVYFWLYYAKGLEATIIWTDRLAYIPYEWSFNGIFR